VLTAFGNFCIFFGLKYNLKVNNRAIHISTNYIRIVMFDFGSGKTNLSFFVRYCVSSIDRVNF